MSNTIETTPTRPMAIPPQTVAEWSVIGAVLLYAAKHWITPLFSKVGNTVEAESNRVDKLIEFQQSHMQSLVERLDEQAESIDKLTSAISCQSVSVHELSQSIKEFLS